MMKSLSIAGITAATIMLGVSFAFAQAPTPGRGDQSGGGAAQISAKPMGAPEAMQRPTMKHRMTMKQRMMRDKRMTRKHMMNRNM
jgi:hypothetical protein